MLDWFIFGDSWAATEASEKYNNVFITAYVALAIIHGWLIYKLFRSDAVWVMLLVLFVVGITYGLTPYNLNNIW